MSFKWIEIAKQLQAIAQAGLEFGADKYDLERYQQIREISIDVMQEHTDAPREKIKDLFASEKGYQTPKVDIRAVVFREGKILMVQERVDNGWTLPGGWADIGLSPFEIAQKETFEEAGLSVKPLRLLAVYDKAKHDHPPDKYHIYKFFILCEDLGGEIKPGMETLDAKWIDRDTQLFLSTPRISNEQIDKKFEYYDNPEKVTECD